MPWAQRFCRGCRTRIRMGVRCAECAGIYEQARGSRQQRGYDGAHDAERARWARIIATGPVSCARCLDPISAGMAWDLGHTDDRRGWTGPECEHCNRSAAGKASHGIPPGD